MDKIKKFLPIFLFLGIFLTIFIYPFRIKVQVGCETQYGECPKEILEVVKKFEGKNLIAARSGIKKEVRKNVLVSDASLQFKLPSRLLVNILIKKPSFNLHSISENKYSLVGQDGLVLLMASNSNLPMVEIENLAIKPGDRVSDDVLFSSRIVLGVHSMYSAQVGRISDEGLVVELPNGIRVIFPLQGDTDVLLGSLRLIYSKLDTEEYSGKYKQIDLRFKNPVLR